MSRTVRSSSSPEALDERRHPRRLAGVHAGRRLVEQQQLGLAGQRAGQLEAALVAVRQVLGGILLVAARQADQLEQLARPVPGRLLLDAHRRQLQQRRPPARLHARVAPDHHVGEHGHGAEQPDVLERAADAELARSRAASGRPAMALRRTRCRPDVGSSMPVSWLKKVVLPAPLGPMSDTIEPRGMVKSMSRLAISPPNRMVTFSATQDRSALGGVVRRWASRPAVMSSPPVCRSSLPASSAY